MSTSKMDLTVLQKRMHQWEKLKAQETSVQERISTMERLLPALETEVQEERSDVESLENGGIVSVFYSAIGRHEEKLDKERQEAWAAEQKYQDALRTCQHLYQDLEDIRAQLDTMGDCSQQYQSALREKRQHLIEGTGVASEQLRTLERQAQRCDVIQREVQEAIDAGDKVLFQIASIEDSLMSASNWGMVDMFGGGFLSDMAKYGRLDDAKQQMYELNRLLSMYSKELKDLDVDLHLSANIGSGMQFADFFFDGLIADSMALNHINRLRDQTADVRRSVQYYRDLLLEQQKHNTEALRQLKETAEELIINA